MFKPSLPAFRCAAIAALSALSLAATAVSAQTADAGRRAPAATSPGQTGGFVGPTTVPKSTVKQLLDTGRDDQKAVLRGHILTFDGGDNYTFDDGTGRISVDIDQKKFPPQAIDPTTVVELIGELDRDKTKVEFDVDLIRIP